MELALDACPGRDPQHNRGVSILVFVELALDDPAGALADE
ncbi:hypothetical protein ASZ90_014175 [hydrocarbon metagenome]|uniref:Uncharacterized protein n=1 Tax=hydrocarbon metagenome TaxID=938273 RepID=A0A0W8F6J6_9ZZZZ